MKLDASKIIPWLVVLTTICGSVYVYAQTITSHTEKIGVLSIRIEKTEDKQEKENIELKNKQENLKNLVIEIDKKLERVLTLLGDKNNVIR